ncbi:primosomal protein N' [Brevibacterium sp.]|uniref:primosomal protein N' family DNA-binding protein n=1 Tax=Brevibacterium sp. TaxID=1701 RepID=UPI0028123131|nr:primosomal protein N' [Brevibacterium sp.]
MDEPLPIDTGTSALGQVPLALVDPVAHVLIDHPVPHLARVFDYAVPEKFADTARPGVRVRVKFAGRLRDGFLLERLDHTDHVGPLAPIDRITSPLQVLTPTLLALCEAVAIRYAGTLPDVLRLAIPPRHARAEKAMLADAVNAEGGFSRDDAEAPTSAVTRLGEWIASHAEAVLDSVPAPGTGESPAGESPTHDPTVGEPTADGGDPPATELQADIPNATTPTDGAERVRMRAALSVVPGETPGLGWITAGIEAALPVLKAGESVLWLVPDHRELAVLSSTLDHLREDHGLFDYSVLNADQSPAQRWTAWLRGLLGRSRLMIGTRAAAFAPLNDLGLIICLDDTNSNYLDQHAPYPHAREVCLLRSAQEETGLLFVSADRSPEVQRLSEIGWLRDVSPTGPQRRSGAPLVFVPDEDRDPFAWQRIPSRAWDLMQSALKPKRGSTDSPGPVLVQVPRSGYYPVFACARCQEVARCPRCEATLTTQSEVGPFACRACGHHSDTFTCSRCRSHQVRSIVRGRTRTVEELRRALPGVEILESGGEDIPVAVDDAPRVVVATTGAEPYALGGYACAVLLDSLWPGPWLRATDDGVSRRLRAASLVRSRENGGAVYLGEADEAIRNALTTFDPITYMSRQLVDRRELGFPPYRRIVELRGGPADLDTVLAAVDPLEELLREDDGEDQRAVAAYPISAGAEVGRDLAAITASRAAKKLPQVHIRIDDPRSL